MKVDDAIKRLTFTISKQNKPNENDVLALNTIIELLNLTNKKVINENLLFVKLYTFLLCEFSKNYTDIDFANGQVNKILQEPMENRIKWLAYRLKDLEYRNYFNRKNILDPFLKEKTTDELEQIHERYKNQLPELNTDEFFKLSEKWNREAVVYILENQINLSIQNFKTNV